MDLCILELLKEVLKMPNVEFFGFEPEEVSELIEKIKRLLKKSTVSLSLRDMVFTEHRFSEVRDENGTKMPYIRLTSTMRKDLHGIFEVLKTLKIDLELIELTAFVPSNK